MNFNEVTTWIEVDRSAIAYNCARISQMTGRPLMAVVKANGYGHGLVESAQAAASGGAAWLGVARIEEAIVLRDNGIQLPILVMGYTSPALAGEAVDRQIALALYDSDIAQDYSSAGSTRGKILRVHIKVDIGMGRLGVFPEQALGLMQWVKSLPGLEIEGVFTHFPYADDPHQAYTREQIERFSQLVQGLESTGMRPSLVHAANSAASLYFPRGWFDMVRSGIAIYGLHPSDTAPLPADFRPAMSLKSRMISIKTLPPGHGVGYNYRYFTTRPERIGVCAIGYADGLRRKPGNIALVEGKRVKVVGGVCMDQCMLQLDDAPEAKIGSEVVWIGQQGQERITAEEVARDWGTINYEVATGMAARVPRFYLG